MLEKNIQSVINPLSLLETNKQNIDINTLVSNRKSNISNCKNVLQDMNIPLKVGTFFLYLYIEKKA